MSDSMSYKQKLHRLMHMILAQMLGLMAFFTVWFLFCATPDYWYEFSTDQYLMLWGYAGGAFSLAARNMAIKLAI
ncbi:MAG: hypothetical protein KAT90_08875 [Gammaproteobacteria bacterium]|nr:hypothetical protein [Gammaproteobacteria bacterium]